MRDTLRERCTLFIKNRDIIKGGFGWESTYIYPLCASLFTAKEKVADVERLKECRDLLKDKTGVFSYFRGASRMATISTLALSQDPEEQMDRLLSVYNQLKDVFWSSEYLTIAATTLVEMIEPHQYESVVERTRAIYNRMKEAHPFLTNSEDSAFAALIALSDSSVDDIAREMEQCYQILKESFFSGNSVQSLSQVLALGEGQARHKCAKVIKLFEGLKSKGYKYGTYYELPTLGGLALLDVETSLLIKDITAVDDFLRDQKGFGAFGTGSKQRLMYAGILTMGDYVPEVQNMETAALNGTVSLIIAQQAAAASAAAAAAGAAAASSST